MKNNYQDFTSVQYIAFDFCGTLADLLPSSTALLKDFFQKNGIKEFLESDIDVAFNKALKHTHYSSVIINTEKLRSDYYVGFNKLVLKYLDLDTGKSEELYSFFKSHKRHWTLNPEALQIISELKKRNYKLVIVSNFDSNLEDVISKLGIHDEFEGFYVSSNIGLEKPSLEFYNHVITSLECSPREIVMVGDSIFLDVYPSIKSGLNCIHIDHSDVKLNFHMSDIYKNRYIKINQLSELANFLP
jgi:2-haloacid dehalogenase